MMKSQDFNFVLGLLEKSKEKINNGEALSKDQDRDLWAKLWEVQEAAFNARRRVG